jgi:glycosyltransferase involved in cell wall biosynthesis
VKTSPLISCIVPVFNGERYLGETLESILAQTYRPLEIIVVDDGSTDGTARVAAAYGDQISYLYQPNAGHGAARNRGLEAARGEYVAFLDADDLWDPRKLALQAARFEASAELDACVTHVQNFWVPELAEEAARMREQRRGQPIPGYVFSALLARRATFEKVGPLDAALAHANDTDWFLRAAEQGVVVELLPDVFVYRRLHQTNVSRTRADQSRDEYLRILKMALDRRRGRRAAP